jgi:hypothetical protein
MDLLTQALMNAQKQRENPYQEAGQGLSSFGTNFINNDRQYGDDDPKDRIVASLLTGLTGAVVQGFGAYQERDRRRTLTNDLMGLSSAYYGGEDLNPLVNSLQSQDAKDLVPMLQMEQASNQRAMAQQIAADRAKRQNDFQYDLLGKTGMLMGQGEGGLTFTKTPLADVVNKTQGGDIPENLRPILAKVLADQPLTLDDANAITGAGRLDLVKESRQNRQINEVGDRFDESIGLRKGQSQIAADLEYITQMVPAPATVAKEQQRQASLNRLQNIFKIASEDPKYDFLSAVGNDAAALDFLANTGYQDVRLLSGTGASLTGNEGEKNQGQLFATFGTDPIGALSRLATGRDQRQFSKDISSLMGELEDARLLKTYGAKRVNKGFNAYDPEILRSIAPNINNTYKSQVDQYLAGVGQQPIASGSPSTIASPKMFRIRDKQTNEIIMVPETELGKYQQ